MIIQALDQLREAQDVRKIFSSAFLFLSLLFLSACSKDLYTIKMITAPDMNDNTACSVMMVFVYDEDTFKKIKAVPVKEWFEKYQSYLNMNPSDLSAIQWELVPDQIVNVSRPDSELDDVVGIIVFADYLKSANSKAALENVKPHIIIQLNKAAVVMTSSDEKPLTEAGVLSATATSSPTPLDPKPEPTSGKKMPCF